MRPITPELPKELLAHFGDVKKVGIAQPFKVKTFRELVEYVAKLSFLNKDYNLFYRGQVNDYKNKAGSSSFYPTIYRGDYLPLRELTNRFDILEGASKALVNLFEQEKVEGHKELKKRKSIQWSILQHYEVCETPYLDFTQSLRVACSFATLENPNMQAYVFVFGLPYQTNRISINSEHDIINIRLLSICPPTAFRPYFQEGYMVGTDDVTTNFDSKSELDFNNRLIAKFEIENTKSFWGKGFHQIPKSSLFPDKDQILSLCKNIKDVAVKELRSGEIGEFLKAWSEIEEKINKLSNDQTQRFTSVREGIRKLYDRSLLTKENLYQLENLRAFRNALVHTPSKIDPGALPNYMLMLDKINKELDVRL